MAHSMTVLRPQGRRLAVPRSPVIAVNLAKSHGEFGACPCHGLPFRVSAWARGCPCHPRSRLANGFLAGTAHGRSRGSVQAVPAQVVFCPVRAVRGSKAFSLLFARRQLERASSCIALEAGAPANSSGQRAHDRLRISCHVMPFPPHSRVNRYQSRNSGPAAAPGRSKNYQQIML